MDKTKKIKPVKKDKDADDYKKGSVYRKKMNTIAGKEMFKNYS